MLAIISSKSYTGDELLKTPETTVLALCSSAAVNLLTTEFVEKN